MLHRDCVPRWMYDELRAEHRALLEKYHALKLSGAVAPAERQGRVVPPPADPAATAEKRAHAALVEALAQDVERMAGVPPEIAKQHADELRKQAFGEAP